MKMPASIKKKRESTQCKNLRNVYQFKDEDKNDAIKSVQRISEFALETALMAEDSTRSVIFARDMLEATADLKSVNSQLSQRAMCHGSSRGSIEENENLSVSLRSRDTTRTDNFVESSEDRLAALSGIKIRKKKKEKNTMFFHRKNNQGQSGIENNNIMHTNASNEVWMCGVCAKSFSNFGAAKRHEDYHIKEIVMDLGWAHNSFIEPNIDLGMNSLSEFQSTPEGIIPLDRQQSNDQTFRPDVLAVSNSTRLLSNRNIHHQSSTSDPKIKPLNITEENAFIGTIQESSEFGADRNDFVSYKIDDYVVLADEALSDVCLKAEKIALSQLEQEAEFELECYSKDKHYYDMLEQREIERQKEGSYSRFRTDGKNFAEKIQNKFVDAYAVMKQGKSKKTMASVDHYKRKLDGDLDVRNEIGNTKQTLYVNVIVKNSIQVVSHELDRLARQRWEEHKKSEGGMDFRNEESRTQFEKFKAAAQGQLVQLAGLALASDFTPRRIAVQLSNDLYRLLTPRLKRRGVFIESEIEYRVGPYFVLAVNIVRVDWKRLVKMTNRDVAERTAKWLKIAESDDAKEGVVRRHGPIKNLMRLSRMTSMEVLAGVLAFLYYTHWVIYTPICWFLYTFLIGETFRKYFLSSVTDEIFYYVEQKGMEMNIQIHDAESQAVCMLSALQEIRADSRALKKKQEKVGSVEGEADLLGPLLGPPIKDDKAPAPPVPDGFKIPENLDFVGLELNLLVGFKRLRWALLSSESAFVQDVVWKVELKYDNVEANEWNKNNDHIGTASKLPDGVNAEDFIGAEKEKSYLMPKSAFVAANTAHETAYIETYNDYCFSLKLKTLTPDVPYGSTFEAWTKYVVINTGSNSCKLTCSVEALFPNGPPMISRQIISGMRDGVGEVFVKTGHSLQQYASAYP